MAQKIVVPNLVIAGAPKCGSTSLYHYLAMHPEICAASKEETRYLIDKDYSLFNNDFNYFSHGLEGYNHFFRHCLSSGSRKPHIFLECTPDYLYQETALNVLSELIPQPTIVFILRNPVMRAYSLFQFARNNMAVLDKKLNFDEFIVQVKEAKAEYLTNRPILRNTLEHGKYINYLKEWLERFGQSSLLVLLFEDMKSNPKRCMKQLATHIGINHQFYESFNFEIKNPTVTIRSQTLHRFKRKWKGKLRIPMVNSIGTYLYNKLNTKSGLSQTASISEKDKQMLQMLYSEFECSNQKLAELFNINISSWKF